LQAVYSVHPQLMRKLESILAEHKPDLVHVEHLRGAQYGLHLRSNVMGFSQATARIPIIWDSVDCISHLFQQAAQHSRSVQGRVMTRLDLPRTRRYEGWLVHQFDRVLVTSPADKAALAQLAVQANGQSVGINGGKVCHEIDEKLQVLPNGVDLEYFAANNTCLDCTRVVFTGKMSYHANVTAAKYLVEEIMPLVWARRPDAELWIVGKDPSTQVRMLASDKASYPIDAPQGRVIVTGSVPDIRPYLYQAAVAVAPIVYGAGIQNKVLEAMACGTPVVASQQAASALDVENGRELLVAKDAPSFAEAIVSLLDNPQRRKELSQTGRNYVEETHSWYYASAALEQVYAKAIDEQRMKL